MSLDYIRKYYHVPAKRGGKVEFQGVVYKILGAIGQYLKAKKVDDDMRGFTILHPTWEMKYLVTTDKKCDHKVRQSLAKFSNSTEHLYCKACGWHRYGGIEFTKEQWEKYIIIGNPHLEAR